MGCRSGLLRIKLKVEVRDKHGKLIDMREKEGDLILDNFRDLLAAILTPYVEYSAATTVDYTAEEVNTSLVDLGGTARTVTTVGVRTVGASDNVIINFLGISGYDATPAGALGVRIHIGTSTVAPSRGDYALGAEITRKTPTQTIGADYISWAVSIVLEAAADVAEAGLSLVMTIAPVGSPVMRGGILLFRDTFTPISVPAGGTISVTYTLSL